MDLISIIWIFQVLWIEACHIFSQLTLWSDDVMRIERGRNLEMPDARRRLDPDSD